MATKNYSTTAFTGNTLNITNYVATDTFNFDVDSISASDVSSVTFASGVITVTFLDGAVTKTINLSNTTTAITSLLVLPKTYFTFADGGQIILGDGLSTTTDTSGATANNILLSTSGNDYMDGSNGTDTASYSASLSAVTVTLANQTTSQNTAGAGIDELKNIENLTGSNYADTLTGDANVNVINGGKGIDQMDGGDSGDTYFATTGDVITDSGASGTDTVSTDQDFSLVGSSGVEVLTLTGTVAIYATGNSGSNTINGNNANNVIDGGTGNDSMSGGLGDDVYFVDSTSDTITEASSTGGSDTVVSTVNDYVLGNTFVDNLRLVDGTGTTILKGTGNQYANVITGNSGNNILDGKAGNDTLIDWLGGSDTLIGGDGVDTLKGGKGNDILIAGSGQTTAEATPAIDNLFGGSGNDTYYVTDTVNDIVHEDASTVDTQDLVSSTVSYSIASVTSAGVDRLTLTGTANINATGNDINNIITGNTGANTLNGGKGNDQITDIDTAGTNVNTLIGGAGADTLTGGVGNDILIGNLAVTDTVGDGAIDTMDGGTGNDTYYVSDTTDVVHDDGAATTAAVALTTTASGDLVKTIVTYTISDSKIENLTLIGTATINGFGNNSANIVTGNANNNVLVGGSGIDSLVGGAGNDTLIGGTATVVNGAVTVVATTDDGSADTMDGGAGNDTYYVTSAGDTVTEAGSLTDTPATNGTDSIISTVSYTLSTNIENLTLNGVNAVDATGNAVANILTGNSEDNELTGFAGADTLYGFSGNDRLIAGDDANTTTDNNTADTLVGGDGNDTYIIDTIADIVNEGTVAAPSTGTDIVYMDIQTSKTALVNGITTPVLQLYTMTANVENLYLGAASGTMGTASTTTALIDITGNASANNITGNEAKNTLIGGTSADTLTGGAGDDTLYSNNLTNTDDVAIDTLIGGAGNDKYYVTATTDVAEEDTSASTAAVQLTTNAALDTVYATLATGGSYTITDSRIENLTLLGTNLSTAIGNASANILTGNAAVNTLDGGAGNDWLDGMGGADKMTGGLGNDTFVVDNANDSVTEASGTSGGIDLIRASVTYTMSDTDVENMTMIGSGSVNGIGNDANNILTGNSAANTLTGGAGNDTLIGGGGKDVLNGNDGVDVFTYTLATDSTAASFDLINDFDNAVQGDTIDLSAAALGFLSFDDVATSASAPTVVANGLSWYNGVGGTFIVGDTTGDTTIDFKIELVGFTGSLVGGTDVII